MAKAGGLLKLDAICARLKSNLQDKNANDTTTTELPSTLLKSKEEAHVSISNGVGGADHEGGTGDLSSETNNNDPKKQDDDKCLEADGASVTNEQDRGSPEKLVETPSVRVEKEEGSSRRKRRKNMRPRALVEFATESKQVDERDGEEYDEYGQMVCEQVGVESGMTENGSGPLGQDHEVGSVEMSDKEEGALDLSCPSKESTPVKSLGTYSAADNDSLAFKDEDDSTDFHTDDYGVMDLSTPRQPSKTADQEPCDTDTSAAAQSKAGSDQSSATSISSKPQVDPSSVKPNTLMLEPMKPVASSDTRLESRTMKNYAENTMAELLSMYGFSEDIEAQSITQSVPLQNFAPRSILERQTGHVGAHGARPVPLHPKQQQQQAALQAVMFAPPLNTTPQLAAPLVSSPVSAATSSSAVDNQTKPEVREKNMTITQAKEGEDDSASTPQKEGMFAKFMDSVSKMAKLPPGTLIGNPPGMVRPYSGLHPSAVGQAPPQPHPHPSGHDAHTNPATDPQGTKAGRGSGGVNTNFATSSAYVKACFDPTLGPKLVAAAAGSPGSKLLLPDYSKYVKRFSSYEECGGNHCQDMSYKEHFHCLDCSFRVFIKKEEMIRHFKWHKKRDDSLQHGFLRFSPMDDCTKKFGSCTHNGRQTHYHCIQPGCTKVYISTSDVQMHANYHRKDSAIIQEGFQRFRATEDCGTQACAFYGQRTTHFHCRREGCSFTFKNKADMEKHKAYHQKDELLSKDGFKKFMKYEHCHYQSCRYSKVSNHIHCIRPGCDYVLHSTGQLYSHKRKHERRDFEHAYKRFKEEQRQKVIGRGGAVHPAPILPAPGPGQLPKALRDLAGMGTMMKGFPNVGGMKKESEYMDLEDLVRMGQGDSSMSGQFSDNSSDDSLGPSNMSLRSPSESRSPIPLDSIKQESGADANEEEDVKPFPAGLAKFASKLTGSALGGSLSLPIPGEQRTKTESEPEESNGLKDVKGQTPAQGQEVKEARQPPTTSLDSSLRPPSPQTAMCPSGFVPKISPPVNEKKERDESWKKFLTRYTANDPCHSRCQFLYKDHYHCNTPTCGMLFRSKDGVREHAKHHDQQDRITSLSYMVYEEGLSCSPGCKYNKGPLHYHCLWADCKEVISSEDHVFSRLEHHKIHEYARVAAGTTRKIPTNIMVPRTMHESMRRRRGRPPKYPRAEIPLVPKIEMTEGEIKNEAKCHPPDHAIASGFRKFNVMEPCPDEKCLYFLREHYHCVRQRCHHSTDRSDVLNLHAKDFHNYVNILEGFEFFDRHINCRRPHCHNNRANRHYHCVRPRCDYSFVRYSTMAQHDKKHKMAEMGLTPSPSIGIPKSAIMGHAPVGPILFNPPPNTSDGAPVTVAATSGSVVRASGTYYPLTSMQKPPASAAGGAIMVAPNTVALPNSGPVMLTLPPGAATKPGQVPNLPVSIGAQQPAPVVVQPTSATPASIHNNPALITIAPKPSVPQPMQNALAGTSATGMPLTVLLQQKVAMIPQLNWLTMKMKMHFGMHQNCGRPFCKLKKKDHYHCFDCNQAFSDPVRLKAHVTKHGIKLDKGEGMAQGKMASPTSGSVIPGLPPLSPGDPSDGLQEDSLSDDEEEDRKDGELNSSSSLNLNPLTFSHMLQKGQQQELQQQRKQQQEAEGDKDSEPGDLVMDLSSGNTSGKANNESVEEENHHDHPAKIVEDTEHDEGMDLEEMMEEEEDESESAEQSSMDGSVHNPSTPVLGTYSSAHSDPTGARRSARKRIATRMQDGFIDSDEALAKMRRLSSSRSSRESSSPRIVKDLTVTLKSPGVGPAVEEPIKSPITSPVPENNPKGDFVVKSFKDMTPESLINRDMRGGRGKGDEGSAPDGYQKYRFSEDCCYDRCAYRQNLTHYHCLRPDCGYSFCDRARIVQHTERHRRLDGVMGDEFQQYRPTVDCARPDCEHSKRTNHFHCLKCPFICTDSSKVLAHRKHHTKMENIQAQGFAKFTGSDDCGHTGCSYAGKQTHYHCIHENCGTVAMGPAQMSAHRVKHENRGELLIQPADAIVSDQ